MRPNHSPDKTSSEKALRYVRGMWWLLQACRESSHNDTGPVLPDPGPHNILLMVIDDVGIERLPMYEVGSVWAETPNLANLASEGVSFETVWAAPVCSPSRAAILTGRYAARTGFGTVNPPQFSWVLPEAEITIPEILAYSPASYTDAAIGKWHLGARAGSGADHPIRSGFTHFSGSMNNLDEGWGEVTGSFDYSRWIRDVDGELDIIERYATRETTDEAIRFIDNAPEPWFLYLSYNAAHSPLSEPPPELFGGPWQQGAADELKQRWILEALDTEIGRLLGSMTEEQRAETTIIVVSDNGSPDYAATGELTEERLKRSPFEGGLRVPLMVVGPLVPGRGLRSEGFVHVVDLFSTVADIADVDLTSVIGADGKPLRIDGVSLRPLLADPQGPSPREVLFSEFFGPNGPPPYQEGFRAVRDRDYKLIRDLLGEPDQLYDMRGRVFEGDDLLPLGLDAEQQAAYDRLSASLEEILAERPYEGPR